MEDEKACDSSRCWPGEDGQTHKQSGAMAGGEVSKGPGHKQVGKLRASYIVMCCLVTGRVLRNVVLCDFISNSHKLDETACCTPLGCVV